MWPGENPAAGKKRSGGLGAWGPLTWSGKPDRFSGRFDPAGFTRDLKQELDRSVAGYVMQLRQHGVPVWTKQSGWARRPGDAGGGLRWNLNQRMHIASVSKMITAMATVKLLAEKNISLDAPVNDYLPAYWVKGPNIERISFKSLLVHRSGLLREILGHPTDKKAFYSDFEFMRAVVAGGATRPYKDGPNKDFVEYNYVNVNYGLLRVLIAVVNGDVPKNAPATYPWDEKTIAAYENYVQRKIFAPSGVTGATMLPPRDTALAYDFPVTWPGGQPDKMRCMAGAVGWYMSVDEVLNVMGTFRRGGKIMPPEAATAMMDAQIGFEWNYGDVGFHSKSGISVRSKKSLDEDTNIQMLQTAAYFLPDDMELVIFANSPLLPSADSAGKALAMARTLEPRVNSIYWRHVAKPWAERWNWQLTAMLGLPLAGSIYLIARRFKRRSRQKL